MPARRLHPPESVAEYTGRGWWTDETVQRLFADCVARYPDETAIVDPADKADLLDLPARRSTWRELDDEVERLAVVLLANGIGEGDVLTVQLPNSIELAVAYLAAWRVRAIVSPLPVQYRRHEMVGLGTISESVAFLTADRIGERAHVAEVLDARAAIPSLRTILHFGPSAIAGAVAVEPAMASVEGDGRERLRAHEAAHPVDPNDCVTICWTSGTESTPKGVPRAHCDWLVMAQGTVAGPGLTHESRLLNPFPMVNMAGLSGMFLPWLRTGCVLVQHHPFDLPVFLGQIRDERVTYTVAPPAILALLLRREDLLATTDLSCLRLIGSGSAPLPEWVVRGWHERYGIGIINFFGSNEGIALMTDVNLMTDPAQRARFFPRYGSGRKWTIPAAGQTTVKLVDKDTGEEITEPGLPGELYLKGPSLFPGYLAGSPARSPFDGDGFLKTGEVFVIDGEDGEFLRYVDRAKDLIIRGGVNISPAELETLIAGLPSVADVAVVGYPDDVLGERVCAVVVPRPGARVSLPDVVTHLNEAGVASYKLPERLVVVAALPRNPVGKVLKRELRSSVLDDI